MVIQKTQRAAGADCMPIQIRKHLLAALKPPIDEKYDGYSFIAEFGRIVQSLFDCRTSMLAIVDDEACGHIYM